MITIILIQLGIVAIWAAGRYALMKYTMFDQNQCHHYDFIVLAMNTPTYIALGFPLIGLGILIGSLIISIDDIYAHIIQFKTNNGNYSTPLRTFCMYYLSWFWRK